MVLDETGPIVLIDGHLRAARTVILAHGAGEGRDSVFMNVFAQELAKHCLRVVRFEFPYMAALRETGKRRPPDREPVLRETWLRAIGSAEAETLFIGGKSMGGRIASLVADDADVAGLVCLGYPFHPTSKPEQLRTEHLKTIKTPTLIVQGDATRSEIGKRSQDTNSQNASDSTGCETATTASSRGSRRGGHWRIIGRKQLTPLHPS